jgi:hypothetical protein
MATVDDGSADPSRGEGPGGCGSSGSHLIRRAREPSGRGHVVPEKAIEQLAAGNRPPVLVTVNGYEYRNTVGVMGGMGLISISAAVRKATGLKGGDPIRVTLTVADTPAASAPSGRLRRRARDR